MVVFATIFGLLATCVLYLGYASFQSSKNSVANYRKASGKVISLQAVDGTHTGTVQAPVVRFQIPDGTEITFVSQVASEPPPHGYGETVEVLYSPEDPEQAVINSFVNLWLLPMVLAGVGTILLIVSAGTFYLARRTL